MVAVFLRYLRHCYMIDEKRLRVLLYLLLKSKCKSLNAILEQGNADSISAIYKTLREKGFQQDF